MAWLRGTFLARGLAEPRRRAGPTSSSSSPPTRRPVLAARLREAGLPAAGASGGAAASSPGRAPRPSARSCAGSARAPACSSSRRGRCRGALRGELNRVINAESANLPRTVVAAGRQLDAIDALDGRRAARASSRRRCGPSPRRGARRPRRRWASSRTRLESTARPSSERWSGSSGSRSTRRGRRPAPGRAPPSGRRRRANGHGRGRRPLA